VGGGWEDEEVAVVRVVKVVVAVNTLGTRLARVLLSGGGGPWVGLVVYALEEEKSLA